MNLNIRAWDWHDGKTGKDHCIAFSTLIPTDEWFIWGQLKKDHATNTTDMIVGEIAEKSGMLKYGFNLIDPLANRTQSTANLVVKLQTTVVFDINQEFRRLKKEGDCTGGIWETWDTKSLLGRERIKTRLRNSIKCKEPYNNAYEKDGIFQYAPTIWINKLTCPDIWKGIAKWCLGKNGDPEQQHSHFCTALEAIEKDIRFKAKMNLAEFETKSPYANYFHMNRS